MSADPDPGTGRLFRDDLVRLHRTMQPSTVACINVTDESCLPLAEFLKSSRVWMVDWEPGRPEQAVARHLLQANADGELTCFAAACAHGGKRVCGSYVPATSTSTSTSTCTNLRLAIDATPRCANYTPGREPSFVIGDGSLGRASKFVARIEEIVALAETPTRAIEWAIEECRASETMDHHIAIPAGSIDLAISVLPPSQRVEGPFELFEVRFNERFGTETIRYPSKHWRGLAMLRTELLLQGMDAHARELYRLVDKRIGGLYFATHPVDRAADGAWSIHEHVPLVFDILRHYFALDFESFPAESVLRRQARGKQVVMAALLRPLTAPTAPSRALPGARP